GVLPTQEYALFTLAIALGNLGYSLAPAGIDGVVNRRRLAAGTGLLGRLLPVCLLVGLGMALFGMVAYDMSPALGAMILVSSAAGGAMTVAGAKFQSERRFARSLLLTQSPNVVLLVAALAAMAGRVTEAWPAVLVSSLGFVLAAVYGWRVLVGEQPAKPDDIDELSWHEALSFAGL